ncbi:MAG: hypothetical protein N2512_04780 [Armatimonadetes bacterium]|nr:hypothetical protein [Armatimonadota bacterium]
MLALAVLAAAPLAPALFGSRVLLPADLLMVMQPFKAHAREMNFRRVSNPILDAVQQFWPWRKYAGEQLRRGVIPLWNPYMLCGTPFVGNNQSAVFYPETWLFAVMRPERAFAWAAFFYLFATGSFMFFFLRGQGLRRRAAMAGAVAWMYNGFVVGWICLPSFRSVPGWLPLILGAYYLSVRADASPARLGWLALAALAVAMQFLAGNLQISFYVLLALAIFVLWVAAREGRHGRPLMTPIWLGAAALILGGALAAIQLLPTIEFAFRSSRVGLAYPAMLDYRLAWPYLLAGLMPDIFGNPVDYNHWGAAIGGGYRAYTETTWYVGALTVVLAVAALILRPRRQVWLWVVLFIVAFALALGSPLNYVFYSLVPGYSQFRGINRAIVLACFALCCLAALGAQRLTEGNHETATAEGEKEQNRAIKVLIRCVEGLLVVGFVGTVAAWIASGAYEGEGVALGPYTWLQFARLAVIVLAGAGFLAAAIHYRRPVWWALAMAVMAADSGYFARHFFPLVDEKYARPPSEIIVWLQEQARDAEARGKPFRILSFGPNALNRMPPNVPMLFGLYDVQGSDSITYRRYDDFFGRRFGEHNPLAIPGFFGARFIVTPEDIAAKPAPPLRLLTTWECNLYEATTAPAMAEIPEKLLIAPHQSLAFQTTANLATKPDKPPGSVAVVDYGRIRHTGLGKLIKRVEPDRCVSVAIPSPRTALAVHRPDPNRIRIVVEPERSGQEKSAVDRAAAPPEDGLPLPQGSAVLVRETCYPGWRAYLDGKPVPLAEANWVQMLVPYVDRPARLLELVYEPTSFTLGCYASLAGAALMAALFVAGMCRPGSSRKAAARDGEAL